MKKFYLKKWLFPLIIVSLLCFQSEFAYADTVTLSNDALNNIKNSPYNDETFKLAYQTFLYNSNISAAYEIALIAVKNRPNDLSWHEKLAQAATWVGDYDTGMQQWVYVAHHTNNIDQIKKAMSLAKLFGYDQALADMLQMYLAKFPNDVPSTLELARTQNRIGQPELALQTLQRLNAKHPSRRSYELMAAIYQDMDQWNNALKVWNFIGRTYGTDSKTAMAQASMYYMQGNAQQALNILKQAIPNAKVSDKDYWETLATLAWIVNDRHLAILGYSQDLNNSSHLESLIELESLTNPKQAFSYSLKGWHQFHTPLFFSHSLYLAQELQQWQSVSNLILSLTPQQLKAAQAKIEFWQAEENLAVVYGDEDLQKKILINGVMLHPNMTPLKSDLLWLELSNGNYRSIKTLMEAWYDQRNDPFLWHAYAEGYDVLNQFIAAIDMYQYHLYPNLNNDQVLIDYGNLLDRARLYQQAYDMRQYLWWRTLLKMNHQYYLNREAIETLSQISPYIVSGTDQVALFSILTGMGMNSNDENIILNWIVPRNDYDLMSFFKAYYLHNHLPDWAEINLDLIKNDRPSLQSIIEHTERQWPRSDRINAAIRLENTQLAEDLAFHELTERPCANEIYPEFTQYGLALANYINVGQEYERFINVIGPRTKFETRLRLTNEWKIRPYASVWTLRTANQNTIVNVPNHDAIVGVKFDQTIHRGNIVYSVAYRKSLDSFTPLAIDINYQLSARLYGYMKLGFNQECLEDSYMRIGGVQDQINLGAIYNISAHESVQVEVQGLNYYSQNRHYLADGHNLKGLYEHRIWLDYPDFTIGIFGNIYEFKRNGSYGGDITRFFPTQTNTGQNYNQIIPSDYSEAGLTFSFGNTIQEYTHAWRPYLWISGYYNSITHVSYNAKAGLNGSVFGRDSLLIYGERGSAPSTANQIGYLIGARYVLYF